MSEGESGSWGYMGTEKRRELLMTATQIPAPLGMSNVRAHPMSESRYSRQCSCRGYYSGWATATAVHPLSSCTNTLQGRLPLRKGVEVRLPPSHATKGCGRCSAGHVVHLV